MTEAFDGSIAGDDSRQFGGSVGPVGSYEGSTSVSDGDILDDVRRWFSRYVHTMHESDLDLLTLWTVHTHLVSDLYTTPRPCSTLPSQDRERRRYWSTSGTLHSTRCRRRR